MEPRVLRGILVLPRRLRVMIRPYTTDDSASVGYVVVPCGTHPRSIKLERLHTVKNPLLAAYIDDLTRPSSNAVKGASQAQKAARVEVTDLFDLF